MQQTTDTKEKPICFSREYKKLNGKSFSTIRTYDTFSVESIYWIKSPTRWDKAKLIFKHSKKLGELSTEFLTNDTDTKTRDEAYQILKEYNPELTNESVVYILRFTWVKDLPLNPFKPKVIA